MLPTLQQALTAFHQKNRKYFSEHSVPPQSDEFLKAHDVAHVVFGCDTSIYGEGVLKTWTTFGTTLNFWKVVRGYKDAEAFDLFKKYSVRHILKYIPRYLAVIPRVIVRAKKMSKPWPFYDYSPYLNTPLAEIRKEFNIRIL